MRSALEGIRVLEVTNGLAGPTCGQLLGDLGADVIQIEDPDRKGPARGGPPYIQDESLVYMKVNRNKRSLPINLRDPRGREVLLRLAGVTDVMVENFRPGALARLGLDYDDIRKVNPTIIYCSISGFGRQGPYRDWRGLDTVVQGFSGMMSVIGEEGRPPVKAGFAANDYGSGLVAAFGILAAYVHRLRTGQGQRVETSLLNTALFFLMRRITALLATGEPQVRMGSADQTAGVVYQAFRTKDGSYLTLAAGEVIGTRDPLADLAGLLGLPELLADERFRTEESRRRHRWELAALLEPSLEQRTAAEWLPILREMGFSCGPVNTIQQVVDDPHVRCQEMIWDMEHPRAGTVRVVGLPVKLSATPGRIHRHAPSFGEHTNEILHEAGYSSTEVDLLRQAGVVA